MCKICVERCRAMRRPAVGTGKAARGAGTMDFAEFCGQKDCGLISAQKGPILDGRRNEINLKYACEGANRRRVQWRVANITVRMGRMMTMGRDFEVLGKLATVGAVAYVSARRGHSNRLLFGAELGANIESAEE